MKGFRLFVAVIVLLWPTMGWSFPQGQWNYVAEGGYDGHKKIIDAEIEKVAKTYNFLVRGIVRSRLKPSNPIFPSMSMAYDGTTLSTSSDNKTLSLTGKNGERTPWVTPEGRAIEIEQTIKEDVAVRIYYNEDGHRVVTYIMGPEQKTLTLDISIHSSQLQNPIRYRLRYLAEK